MEFFRYSSLMTKQSGSSRLPFSEFYLDVVDRLSRVMDPVTDHGTNRDILNLSMLEASWWDHGRPYYNMYPSLVSALLRVRLDVPWSQLLLLPPAPLSLRFAKGFAPWRHHRHGGEMTNLLLSVQTSTEFFARATRAIGSDVLPEFRQKLASVTARDGGLYTLQVVQQHVTPSRERDAILFQMPLATKDSDVTVEELFETIPRDRDTVPQYLADLRSVLRLCIAVSLLPRDDGTLITPDVLNDDRTKLGQGRDDELHQKAVRRRGGEIGWDVGREIWEKRDVSPHYRNPHLAHFWVGEGRTRCVLKLRAGSVVKRHLMRQVPTGYESLEEANGSHVDPAGVSVAQDQTDASYQQ